MHIYFFFPENGGIRVWTADIEPVGVCEDEINQKRLQRYIYVYESGIYMCMKGDPMSLRHPISTLYPPYITDYNDIYMCMKAFVI